MNAPMSAVARSAVAQVKGQGPHYLNCAITLVNGDVLGTETFRLASFEGKEHISEPFEFTLSLRADSVDGRKDGRDALCRFSFSQLIGRPVEVRIALSDTTVPDGANIQTETAADGSTAKFAVFHGMVASFGMQEPGVYQLIMRPILWRMTLTNNYRMLRDMSVRDVLAALCREHRVPANFDGVSAPDNLAVSRVQDWLQAGESDFEFMRRLMGKAHIYFYFSHQHGQHTLVFANSPSYPRVYPDNHALRYVWTSQDEQGLHQSDVVSQYSFQQSMGCSGVRGVFAVEGQAANVEGGIASYASFEERVGADGNRDIGELPFNQYRVYQYGGSDREVRHYIRASNEALQTANSQLSGSSFCPLFRVAHKFRLSASHHPVRPELERSHYVLTEVNHHASLDGEYSNQFQAVDAKGLVTPLSVADTQQGAVLAKVVAHRDLASPGTWPYYTPDNFDEQDEALVDEQGVSSLLQAKGVYVQLCTDELESGKPVWVKLAPHMQTVPEVGTMVMVSRANDESELPEIQPVHSDGSRVVTSSEWTAHSSVGSNFSTSYGDGKSIRFGTRWSGADTDNAVNIVESAYDRKVFRDTSYSRGGSYSYSCSEDMEKGMLGESWSYGCNYSNSWSKESKGFSAVGRTYQESVVGLSDTTLQSTEQTDPDALAAVQASRTLVVGNTYSNSTSNGNTKSVAVYNGMLESFSTHNGTVSSETTHNASVSSVTTINADQDSTTTVTGTSTSHTDQANVHNFTTIGAQSSSTAIGASNSNDAIGITNSNSLTGVRNSNSLTGVAIDLSLQGSVNSASVTGISANLSVTGSSNGINVVGAQTDIGVTGDRTSISVVGASTSIDVLGSGLSLSVKGATVSIDISGPSIQIPVIVMVV